MRLVVTVAFVVAISSCTTTASRTSHSQASSINVAGCLDTLRARDTIQSIVKLTLELQDSAASFPPEFADLFAEAFKSHFSAPRKLSLGVVAGWEPCDSTGSRCAGGVLYPSVSAYFIAHRTGRLSRISIVDASLSPTLATALRSALNRISSERSVPWTASRDSLALHIVLGSEDSPDSVPSWRQLYKLVVPHYDLPFSAATMPATGIETRYPLTAELAGVEDTVVVAFTVDADGSVAPESMEMLSARYRDFVASVATALLNAQYHPARLGDCPVGARLKQRFVFTAPR